MDAPYDAVHEDKPVSESPGREIARRDEILEFLYWVEGEGLQGSGTLPGMIRFLSHPEAEVRRALGELMTREDIVMHEATGEYQLTPTGRREAARRFAEEFAPLLGQGHGECSDPNCDCHTNPEAAAECHAARAHGSHAR